MACETDYIVPPSPTLVLLQVVMGNGCGFVKCNHETGGGSINYVGERYKNDQC